MYKLLSIEEYGATRDLLLENLKNHKLEKCFDDSILIGFTNFDFMEIGKDYECKILLFGHLDEEGEVFINLGDEKIGNKSFYRVSDNDDKEESVYYIEKTDNQPFLELGAKIYFSSSRKDLIQVNNVVYPTYRTIDTEK